MTITELFEKTIAAGASDLHLVAGVVPTIRIDGRLTPITTFPPLTNQDIEGLPLIYAESKKILESVDFHEKQDINTIMEMNSHFTIRLEKLMHKIEESLFESDFSFILEEKEKRHIDDGEAEVVGDKDGDIAKEEGGRLPKQDQAGTDEGKVGG